MDLGVLIFSEQSRSDNRAADLLEQMAATDTQHRSQHLAAATRFRTRAGRCRDLLSDQPAALRSSAPQVATAPDNGAETDDS